MPQFAEFGLIRSIRKWDLVAVTVNAVVGAGIFGLPSKVYGLAGSYSLPAFLLSGIFAAMIVLCFAEVETLRRARRKAQMKGFGQADKAVPASFERADSPNAC